MANSETYPIAALSIALVVTLAALLIGCATGEAPEDDGLPTDAAPAVTTIRGRVEPRVSGIGVIGVRNGVAAAIASTDDSGVYALLDIPAGEYNLIASGPGFFTDTSARNVVVERGDVTEAPLITMRPISAAATLRGQALDDITGEVMAGVQVTVECRAGVCSNITALTDEDGRFEVSIWPDLTARLIFRQAGYAPAFLDADEIESGGPLVLPAARMVREPG